MIQENLRQKTIDALRDLRTRIDFPLNDYYTVFRKNGEVLIRLGKNAHGSRKLLIPRKTDSPVDAELISSAIEVREDIQQFKEDSKPAHYFRVDCIDPALTEVFDELTLQLVEAILGSSESPESLFRERISEWRRLLRPEQDRISRDRVIGLFGELTILRHIAESAPQQALNAWSGYRGHRHDFTSHKIDIEVKTTTSENIHSLSVTGITQLKEIDGIPLVLARIGITEHPAGENIRDLIDSIVSCGINRDTLESATIQTFGHSNNDWFNNLRFKITTEYFYRVDDSFPSLTFAHNENMLPRGISNLRYDVDLTLATRLTSTEVSALWNQIVG